MPRTNLFQGEGERFNNFSRVSKTVFFVPFPRLLMIDQETLDFVGGTKKWNFYFPGSIRRKLISDVYLE